MQFFIEAVDSGLPNIIDSLLINLDNLQLGADFTEEMTFTGYHNISYMTMSFRVTCQNGSCGRDCNIKRISNPRILSCNSTDGDIVCTDSRYDPSANCNGCLHNLDISTDCSTCLEPNFDPDTNCTDCLPGYDGENCQVTNTVAPTTLNAALVGGVAGGVGGSLLLVIIVVVIVCVLVCLLQRRGQAKFNVSGK